MSLGWQLARRSAAVVSAEVEWAGKGCWCELALVSGTSVSDTIGIEIPQHSHVAGVVCGFRSWLGARQGQERWDCP